MKKLVVCIVLVALNTSCDKLDELTEVDFTTTLTEEFFVNIDQNGQSFFANVNFDLSQNGDIAPYINKIQNIEIQSANYKIKNFQGSENASGTITVVANQGNTFGPYTHSFLTDAQSQVIFPFTGATQLNNLSSEFETTKMLSLNFSGLQDQATNSTFMVEVTFNLKVTANAL
jgi:hypothetical protein